MIAASPTLPGFGKNETGVLLDTPSASHSNAVATWFASIPTADSLNGVDDALLTAATID